MSSTNEIEDEDAFDFDFVQSGNPFPGSDKRSWIERLAEVLSVRTGLPKDVAFSLAVFVVRPKDSLRQRGGEWHLAEHSLADEDGLLIFKARMHGFAGTPGEYNERIRNSFDSPLSVSADPDYVLPSLKTGVTGDGKELPILTTTEPVDVQRLAKLLERMEKALDTADGERGYRLQEDIAVFGQKEPTLHAVFQRQIAETVDGGTRVRLVPDLTAIKGANRSRARLSLFGLTVHDIVFGINPHALVGVSKDYKTAEPAHWVPLLADLLKIAYEDPNHPGHKLARKAASVATVDVQVIVGASDLTGFHTRVFDPNRVDHRRPPLDYALSEKAASDLRAVLRDLNQIGDLSEAKRAWLSGEGRDPHEVPNETIVDRRDRRDRELFAIMFPADPAARKRLRRTLGEPAPSQTGRRHVDARTRMISAVVSDAYEIRWNPRVLDGLMPTDAIRQVALKASNSWQNLLVAAEAGDLDALRTFVLTRGMHWLAEHKIVQADRGSVGAQVDDPDTETHRIRRTQTSIRDALLLAPHRTVGFMRELARAANAREKPRQVDVDGTPVQDTEASKPWFDNAFPKTARKSRSNGDKPTDNPQMPDLTPGQILLNARVGFENAVTGALPKAFADVLSSALAAAEAAAAADTTALNEEMTDLLRAINDALAAVKTDQKTLMAAIPLLQQSGVDQADFWSECDAFLAKQADA